MSTICAISTAKGGAIGIIRTSGPDAIRITDSIFRGRKKLSESKPYTLNFGQIIDERAEDCEVIDEVLVSIFHGPRSYTGEDSTEISCHGSQYILQRIIELLINNGCELAKPGEYTQRAFLNGKIDLSQAEAVADLIASQNKSTHRIALQQLRGGYSNKLKHLRNQLLEMTSLLELELDFSEEDVEFAEREKLINLAEKINDEISRLTESFRLGNALKNGVSVAIIGAPNVGKSTLLNALLHEDKAIVSDIKGTTRDLIEDTITIDDITFRFIDTAGIRHTNDTIELLGIERSIRAAEKAQIIILMREPGVEYPNIDISDDQTVIYIDNKTDEFQALHGIGIVELERKLVDAVGKDRDDDFLVTNMRHFEALSHAGVDIKRAIDSLKMDLSGDIVSEDLRQCLFHLSEILGNITSDEILGNIFANFCIGK